MKNLRLPCFSRRPPLLLSALASFGRRGLESGLMRPAEAEALPERHSSVPYSLFNELESFRSHCKDSLAKACQSVKQIFKLFSKWQRANVRNGGISAVFLNAGTGVLETPAAGSTLSCSSTQTERIQSGKYAFLYSAIPISISGEVPFPLKPIYQRAASVSRSLGDFFRLPSSAPLPS